MKSALTTLCYIRRKDEWLMLHRVKKENDENHNKWIGVGGHFEAGESPEDCLLREVREETGLTLTDWQFRGLVTFDYDDWPAEYMCLYTADGFTGTLCECSEGELAWIPQEKLQDLPMWEGDRLFWRLLQQNAPFFSLKLEYSGGKLVRASLDGKPIPVNDDRQTERESV